MTTTRTVLLTLALATGCGGTVAVDTTGTGAAGTTGTGGVTTTHSSDVDAGGTGGAGGFVCNPSAALCKSLPPQCSPGQVPSVVDACWGPCVDVLSCAPEPDCSKCTSGFCAAYVAWTTEYRCVLPAVQCQALACSCLAPYLCPSPFGDCSTNPGGEPPVTCSCPTC
jgi:hypothetical protein